MPTATTTPKDDCSAGTSAGIERITSRELAGDASEWLSVLASHPGPEPAWLQRKAADATTAPPFVRDNESSYWPEEFRLACQAANVLFATSAFGARKLTGVDAACRAAEYDIYAEGHGYADQIREEIPGVVGVGHDAEAVGELERLDVE